MIMIMIYLYTIQIQGSSTSRSTHGLPRIRHSDGDEVHVRRRGPADRRLLGAHDLRVVRSAGLVDLPLQKLFDATQTSREKPPHLSGAAASSHVRHLHERNGDHILLLLTKRAIGYTVYNIYYMSIELSSALKSPVGESLTCWPSAIRQQTQDWGRCEGAALEKMKTSKNHLR